MMYQPSDTRYETMEYKRCGRSGVLLPRISLGLWQNFGIEKTIEEQKKILFQAFDLGIVHFDLANNYGAPAVGKAEENLGRILKEDLMPYRDELLISTKAGYDCWPGPYGNWGSRKYLTASLDASLRRLGLDYVDIFYHHRPDPETPMEETAGALSDLVRRGKALYIGISNYREPEARKMTALLKENGTPCLIHQPRYNMLERWVEDGLLGLLEQEGVGCICFSPLAQGALTDKYLHGIPSDSRASRRGTSVGDRYLSKENLERIGQLNQLAAGRGQTMAQMALSWVLRRREVTSVLIGASSPRQLKENVQILRQPDFSQEELEKIDHILAGNSPKEGT